MSKYFETEAELSGTESEDEDEHSLITPEDLLFIHDSPLSQHDSPSFYRALSSSPLLSHNPPLSPPPLSTPTQQPTPRPGRAKRDREPDDAPQPLAKKQDTKTKKFRLQSKGIFLTFPQCDYPLDSFFDNLKSRFSHINDRIFCSREQHEDGSWHLHAALLLQKKLDTQNVEYFDNLVEPSKHPNIQSKLKSQSKTVAYVMKGPDDSWKRATHPWKQFLQLSKDKQSTKAQLIMETIEKTDLMDPSQFHSCMDLIDQAVPGYLVLHHHQVQDYLNYRRGKALRLGRAAALQITVRVRPALTPLISSNVSIARWLNSAIRIPRPHRSHQMWIKAPPCAGKTTMIQNLEKWFKLNIYWWPKDEVWWDAYEDGAYDLIVLDEFKSQKKITDLNPILSGDPVPLSRRRAAPYVKRDNLPVIILSNFSPEECYCKCSAQQLAPLLDRIEFIEVSNTVRIEKEE